MGDVPLFALLSRRQLNFLTLSISISMSFFEAPAAILLLLSLLTLPLFSNEFGTDALSLTISVSLSASKIPS